MIAFVENNGLQLNNSDLQVEAAQEKWPSELPQLRAKLEYCRKVKAVLDAFGLDLEINIQETTDIDVRNLLEKTRAGEMREEEFTDWLTRDIRGWGTMNKTDDSVEQHKRLGE